jgi:hypothetical protein
MAIMKEAGKNLVTVMREVIATEAKMTLVAMMTKNLKSREAPLLTFKYTFRFTC